MYRYGGRFFISLNQKKKNAPDDAFWAFDPAAHAWWGPLLGWGPGIRPNPSESDPLPNPSESGIYFCRVKMPI